MNIGCFGCSFTAGMPENNWYSWPEKLASIRVEDNIYNLAVGGSSILFSIYLLDVFSKSIKFDKVIFQITNPHRFSTMKKNSIDLLEVYNERNYYRLDPKIRKDGNIITITPADTTTRWSTLYEKIKFAKQYYSFYNTEIGLLEYEIQKKFAIEKSNISFDHSTIPTTAKNNTIDNFGHFNNIGHNIIGDWINDELERNLH